MKLIYMECNAEEMKANRTFMDALTDIAESIVNTFNSPVPEEFGAITEEEMAEGEE